MPSTVGRVARNSGFLFFADAISKILHLVLVVFIARMLGDVSYGQYAFAFAFTALFVIFSDFGLSVLSIRDIARDTSKAGKYLSSVSIIKTILSLITFALIVIVINLMNYPQDTTQVVYITGATVICISFSQFFRSIFRAFERMEYELLTRIAEEILIIGAGLTTLFLGYGLIELVLVILAGRFAAVLASFMIVITKFAKPYLAVDINLIRQMFKAALPFGLAIIFTTIYFQIDSVMLSVMKGDAVVGWYNASYQLVLALIFIPAAFISSLYPLMSRYFESSKERLNIVYEKAFKYLFTLAVPIGVGITLLADRIIAFLYGADFSNSVIALQVLIWAGSLIFLTLFAGHTFASINKQRISTLITGICVVVNIILNLILIPRYSLTGAAIATVATEFIVLILSFSYLQKHFHRLGIHRIIMKPLIAVLIMGIIVYALNAINSNLFATVLAGAVSYGVLIYLLRVLDSSDINSLRNVFRR
jgi:O-antigen/teichoic acid export membrane protein